MKSHQICQDSNGLGRWPRGMGRGMRKLPGESAASRACHCVWCCSKLGRKLICSFSTVNPRNTKKINTSYSVNVSLVWRAGRKVRAARVPGPHSVRLHSAWTALSAPNPTHAMSPMASCDNLMGIVGPNGTCPIRDAL